MGENRISIQEATRARYLWLAIGDVQEEPEAYAEGTDE